MKGNRLKSRDKYLKEAMLFRDTDLIKVITGVRRCGKSSLLDLIRMAIESEGVAGRGFVDVNLESKGTGIKTENELYNYVRGRLSDKDRTYVFIDEPQRIEGWQDAVNAMRVDFDCDIYLTGSNAYLLSSELSTYLSGRYVEVKMLPLSFSEFANFCGVEFASGRSAALAPDGEPVLFDEMLTRYLEYGGMPAIASLTTTQAQHSAYMSGIYEAIAVRDIVNRERGKSKSTVTDPSLLRHVAEFLADNIGNEFSPNGIAGALTSTGSKTTNKTVSSYVGALEEAFLFYRATRYDLHGKALLKTNPKEYIVDTGFRTWMAGYRVTDTGRLFENAVFLQLLYEGWSVHVGKLYGKEVDFVATKDGRVLYVQATDEMFASETREARDRPSEVDARQPREDRGREAGFLRHGHRRHPHREREGLFPLGNAIHRETNRQSLLHADKRRNAPDLGATHQPLAHRNARRLLNGVGHDRAVIEHVPVLGDVRTLHSQ